MEIITLIIYTNTYIKTTTLTVYNIYTIIYTAEPTAD